MTGPGHGRGGGQRGTGRDRERGGDRYQPGRIAHTTDPTGQTPRTSVEELGTVRLPPTTLGRPRLGIGGTIAIVAVVALLATGFGVLGGRPGPSPSPAIGAVVPTNPTKPPRPPTAPPTPRITPFSTCAAARTEPFDVQLQVNGRPISGFIDVFGEFEPMPALLDPSPVREHFGAPVSVPIDVISELWVVGGACALGWHIGLLDGDLLDGYETTPRDAAVAAQNRFALTLAPYAGRDEILQADLFFQTSSIRAAWLVHVEPFERPAAVIRQDGGTTPIVEGCDVEVTLGNGYTFPRPDGCDNDMPRPPDDVLLVEDGLQFELPGWEVTYAAMSCGHLGDESFVPDGGCSIEGAPNNRNGAILFELGPDLEGRWAIAISACAQSTDFLAANRICGSWYAEVMIVRGG